MSEMMNTREVAEYLRIKERKVYDLVRSRRIPCTRVTGKWLFPKTLIDRWLLQSAAPEARRAMAARPQVISGSHDPLLEWAARESRCELALLTGGSLDGLTRLAAGEAMACGVHVFDPGSETFNLKVIEDALADRGVVAIEWAWREQGLVLAPGNPLGITGLTDLADGKARIVDRQPESGAHLLFRHLLAESGVKPGDLAVVPQPARNEQDVALSVLEGRADAGLAIRAVARQVRAEFVPLKWERFDLVLFRRDYFEPPFQKLLGFCHSADFAARANEMGGYDVTGLGRVVYNGP